jgi:ADP-ribosylglycohydrolase
MVKDYLPRVYAGFLGMNIGIRLGAPVEPSIWTYERIRDTYGDITGYVKEYKNFAADDDANGPFYFLRALYDKPAGRDLTAEDVADAWLNYTREGVGMFWWGGYGVSTEHTAYLNLRAGLKPPQSGCAAQNGETLAEQIGGQIFIDTWGLINPGQPARAAQYGEMAASVSHGGEGLLGARFFCAAIAAAFTEKEPLRLIQAGLAEIPQGSRYAAVVKAVLAFHAQAPGDWRACRAMLAADWGYDKYPGACHIIPNAGVCALALAYGAGDFARTVEIAAMAGWDTDCNAGNVGTVAGVAAGLEGLPAKYREPINDGIVLSGISGALNIVDIPTYAKELALLGWKLAGEEPPKALGFRPGEIDFDFALPGATHGMRVSDPFFCRARHCAEPPVGNVPREGNVPSGALEILVDRMSRGDQCRVFYKPFYTRGDFSDERYSPVFSPTVYSGQTLRLTLWLEQWNGWEALHVAPYLRESFSGRIRAGGFVRPQAGAWTEIVYELPDTAGDLIDEVGLIVEGASPAKAKTLGQLLLGGFSVAGKARYTLDVGKQRAEFGTVTPFAVEGGALFLEGGRLVHMRRGPSFAYGGNYFSQDYRFEGEMIPLSGPSHLLAARAKGTLWGYGAGFGGPGLVGIYKNSKGFSPLAEASFPWAAGRAYRVAVEALGDRLTLAVDGKPLLEARDPAFTRGMYGFGSLGLGRTAYGGFQVTEL